MIVVGSTMRTIVNTANTHSNELGGKTVTAFPDKYFSTPLKQTMFSLGIKKIQIGPRIDITDSNGNVMHTRDRIVDVSLSINVYVPHSLGGDACTKGFDRFMDFLVRTLQYDVLEAGCQEVEYDQSIGTNVLKGYFTLRRTISETTPIID